MKKILAYIAVLIAGASAAFGQTPTWRVKDVGKAAGVILNATSRFHHSAMVQLDEGKSDLAELDALVDVLIAGLAAH